VVVDNGLKGKFISANRQHPTPFCRKSK